MKDNQAKYPQLRFKGFTDPWEKRKLSNVVSLLGGNAFKSKDSVTEEGVRWLKIANVSNSGIKWNEESFLPSDYWERYPNYRIVAGDYVMALTRPIIAHELKIAKMPLGSNALLNQRVAKLIWNMNADFGFQLLRKRNVVDYIEQTISGTDPPNLSGNTFEKIMVSVPETVEQEKIGRFLETVDNLLAVNQRKLDLLKEQKKGYLQKMFPKNGAKVPELRFAGFADDWEERKLGELGSTFTGLTGKTKEDFGHGDAKFVTYMNVFQNAVASLEQLDSVEIDPKQNEVKKGDVFFTTSSETPEEVGMSSVWKYNYDNVYLNSFTFGYRPNIEFDLDYLAAMLRSTTVRKKITFLAQGISRYNISKTKMMDIEVPVPSLEEQAKIGAFLSNVEQTITLHQRKLDLLKEQKKGFLQKMFV